MSFLRRIVTLLVIVSVCLWGSSRLRAWLHRPARLGTGAAREPVTLSHTFLLKDDHWLDFHLPQSSQLMWMLTNANFPKTSAISSNQIGPSQPAAVYAVQYQFLNSRRQVLHTGTYHFRARPPTIQQVSHPRAFYTVDNLLPGLGQSMRQQLTRLDPRPSRIRLRLGQHDDRIREVAVRLYCEDEVPEYSLRHAWQRTSHRQREKLSRASVYGAELLTNYERRNLLKKKWLAIAPSGVEGRDHERRILYTRTTEETEEPISTELPAGLLVGNRVPEIVPIPDGPGSVRLEFLRVKADPGRQPVEIDLRWFGKRLAERDQWRIQPAKSLAWETELDGGMLEILSTEEFTVRAYWQGKAARKQDYHEITPDRMAVRTYVVGPDSPVEYSIEHVQIQPTPLKLAFRQVLPLESDATSPEAAFQPAGIVWSFLGRDGGIIRSGELELKEASSRYDRATAASGSLQVTDATVRFFSVPPDVRSVRLESSNAGVVVSAYNRPLGVARVTFVPEDYSAFHRKQGWRQSWFLLRPVNHLQRANALQTVTLLTQTRPRELDEEELAGEYRWESFQPSGVWKGRYVLLPRPTHLPLRWEALGVAFFELQTGVSYDLALLAEPGHRSVAPRVVCHTEGPLPGSVRVYVNDQLHQELRLRSRLADLSLEALPAVEKTVRLRIETDDDTRVLMNRIERPAETVFFKRLVNRIEGKTLRFEVEKRSEDEELFGLTLFHAATEQRARLRVRIIGNVTRDEGPSSEWTMLDRVFELRPIVTELIPTFAADSAGVFEQHPCFLRLGSDLPAAKYGIEITREDDQTGYLLLSRTISGLTERRRLATEPAPKVVVATDAKRRN